VRKSRNSWILSTCLNSCLSLPPVNFGGTANANGASVFAVKEYDFVDANIGYTFVNMLTKSDKGKVIANADLLNVVTVQDGGGAEPFTDTIVGENEGWTLPITMGKISTSGSF
jgi:hypothetical protein